MKRHHHESTKKLKARKAPWRVFCFPTSTAFCEVINFRHSQVGGRSAATPMRGGKRIPMSLGRTLTKKGEKLIGLSLLILFIVGAARGGALAEEEGAAELGQGVRWLPRLTFPPSDPSKEAGYLPLVGRDFSLEYLYYTFYLSSKRGDQLLDHGGPVNSARRPVWTRPCGRQRYQRSRLWPDRPFHF